MPAGAFRVYQDKQNPRDIHFELVADGPVPVPEEQIRLRDGIDQSLMVLRMLFPDNDIRFNEYFRPLLSLAQAGLVGENPQPEVSIRALVALKQEITAREGGRVKNQYMKSLGKNAVVIAAPTLLIAVILRWQFPQFHQITNFFLLWSGCMAGVWLSFGARKTFFNFEDLHIPEQDRLEPLVRLIFAGLLTTIIGLLFSTKAVVVSIGAITTDQINESDRVALLIGMLCGFSEQVLSSQIAKHASTLLDNGKG